MNSQIEIEGHGAAVVRGVVFALCVGLTFLVLRPSAEGSGRALWRHALARINAVAEAPARAATPWLPTSTLELNAREIFR